MNTEERVEPVTPIIAEGDTACDRVDSAVPGV